jgi:hypothetical protein
MEDRIARLRIAQATRFPLGNEFCENSRSIQPARLAFICMSRRFRPELLQLLTPGLLPVFAVQSCNEKYPSLHCRSV